MNNVDMHAEEYNNRCKDKPNKQESLYKSLRAHSMQQASTKFTMEYAVEYSCSRAIG